MGSKAPKSSRLCFSVWPIVAALALVAANAFFVAVEFALVKVRATQLEALVEQGKAGASLALAMRNRLDTWLSACQVGITLASLALGWVGEPAFAVWVEPAVRSIVGDGEAAEKLAHTVAIVVAFGIITFLHIVLGEQVPKTIAIDKADTTAVVLAWPMKLFASVFAPVIALLNMGTSAALKIFGIRALGSAEGEGGEALDENELRLVFSRSAESGALNAERAKLLERALSMMQKTAKQVLVPRSQMKSLDLEATLEQNVADARAAGHTWLPVVRGNLDRVEGVVNIKDLLFLLAKGDLKSVGQVQRPVLFVPERATLEQLLSEFRRRKKQLAVVVDEHGGTTGLVTLADVVSELVGDVAEMGRRVDPVKSLPGGRLELPGATQLDDLEHTLEIEFDVDKADITTIAGYLMAKLGRVPIEGDVWKVDVYTVRVLKTGGPRVITVRIEPHEAPSVPSNE